MAGDNASVAIVGDSAGGHLAAVVCRRLRDALARDSPQNVQPVTRPSAEVLVYPTLDAFAYREAAYPSHRECVTGYGLEYDDGLAYWSHYLGPQGARRLRTHRRYALKI